MFFGGFRHTSSHLTKCHSCHGICTLSPFHAALTMRFKKRTTRHVSNDNGGLQSAAPATKTATQLQRTTQEYCACHTKRLSARYETCWGVTKCHTCHAKRSYATCGTSTSNHFCRTHHRHGHTALTRPPADGCERKRNVE